MSCIHHHHHHLLSWVLSRFFFPSLLSYQVVTECLYENHGREEVVHLDTRAFLSSLPSPFLIAYLRHIIIIPSVHRLIVHTFIPSVHTCNFTEYDNLLIHRRIYNYYLPRTLLITLTWCTSSIFDSRYRLDVLIMHPTSPLPHRHPCIYRYNGPIYQPCPIATPHNLVPACIPVNILWPYTDSMITCWSIEHSTVCWTYS